MEYTRPKDTNLLLLAQKVWEFPPHRDSQAMVSTCRAYYTRPGLGSGLQLLYGSWCMCLGLWKNKGLHPQHHFQRMDELCSNTIIHQTISGPTIIAANLTTQFSHYSVSLTNIYFFISQAIAIFYHYHIKIKSIFTIHSKLTYQWGMADLSCDTEWHPKRSEHSHLHPCTCHVHFVQHPSPLSLPIEH